MKKQKTLILLTMLLVISPMQTFCGKRKKAKSHKKNCKRNNKKKHLKKRKTTCSKHSQCSECKKNYIKVVDNKNITNRCPKCAYEHLKNVMKCNICSRCSRCNQTLTHSLLILPEIHKAYCTIQCFRNAFIENGMAILQQETQNTREEEEEEEEEVAEIT